MPGASKRTEAEIEQRQQAARKHGTYAFRERGESALNPPQRSRLQELKDQVREREGVVDLLQERAASAVMMVELITSYIAEEHEAGKPLSRIKTLHCLPAFMNTAQRALKDLIGLMPEGDDTLDAVKVLEDLKGNGKD